MRSGRWSQGGHVGVLCAEPVTDPASYRGAHGIDRAGVEKEGGGTMRHPFGVHAVNEAKLVDVFGCFWKQGGDPMTALPVTLKFPKGLHHHLLGVFPVLLKR